MAKTVTRADLCEAVYDRVGLSRTESAALVELVLKEITDCLERGETVKLSSFGSFIVRHKGQRVGRNPKTGTEVPISPRRVMVFKPSAILKQRINTAPADKAAFDAWVKAQQAPPVESTDPLAQQGKALFTQQACVGCHTIRGVSAGQVGPDLTHFGSRKTLAANLMPATAANVARWIENPGHMKPGTRMPDLGMRGEQSKALAAYLLSLK